MIFKPSSAAITITVTHTPPLQVSKRIRVQSTAALERAMATASKSNESGLPPQESTKLPERNVRPHEQRIVDALKELYTCRPQVSTYNIYAPNAVFRDPISIAEGLDSIKSQFSGLPKLFPRADITKFRLLSPPDSSSSSLPTGTLLIDQVVAYYRDPSSASPTKTLNSLLTIYVDSNVNPPVVTKHVEEWNHQRDATREDGFFGMLNDYRKKMTASVVDTFVSKVPPRSKD